MSAAIVERRPSDKTMSLRATATILPPRLVPLLGEGDARSEVSEWELRERWEREEERETEAEEPGAAGELGAE